MEKEGRPKHPYLSECDVILACGDERMLVLSRREGESIVIKPSIDVPSYTTIEELFADGGIELTVLETNSGSIRQF